MNPDQAEIVREIFARCVAGRLCAASPETISSPRGSIWDPRTIFRLLENPAYNAMAWDDDGNGNRLSMDWEPIVDRDVWDKVTSAPLRPARRGRQRPIAAGP
jgi:hypothetical protein